MIYLAVLMIVVMVVVSAMAIGVVLRAPLVQEFHLGDPERLRATVTATVVRPVQSPREAAGGHEAAATRRVIAGEIEP
jgi:hypothetical protein